MADSVDRRLVEVISANRTVRAETAKVDVRKPENPDWLLLGAAVERLRTWRKLSLKEFAARLKRNDRQVARWIAGTEPTQLAAIFAVKEFRQPFVIALAEAAEMDVVAEIRARLSA